MLEDSLDDTGRIFVHVLQAACGLLVLLHLWIARSHLFSMCRLLQRFLQGPCKSWLRSGSCSSPPLNKKLAEIHSRRFRKALIGFTIVLCAMLCAHMISSTSRSKVQQSDLISTALLLVSYVVCLTIHMEIIHLTAVRIDILHFLLYGLLWWFTEVDELGKDSPTMQGVQYVLRLAAGFAYCDIPKYILCNVLLTFFMCKERGLDGSALARQEIEWQVVATCLLIVAQTFVALSTRCCACYQLRLEAMKAQRAAMESLLNAACDVTLHVDKHFAIIQVQDLPIDCAPVSYDVARGTVGGFDVRAGEDLSQCFATLEETMRFREFLGCSKEQATAQYVLHSKIRDSKGQIVLVDIFRARYHDYNQGEEIHIVAIRETFDDDQVVELSPSPGTSQVIQWETAGLTMKPSSLSPCSDNDDGTPSNRTFSSTMSYSHVELPELQEVRFRVDVMHPGFTILECSVRFEATDNHFPLPHLADWLGDEKQSTAFRSWVQEQVNIIASMETDCNEQQERTVHRAAYGPLLLNGPFQHMHSLLLAARSCSLEVEMPVQLPKEDPCALVVSLCLRDFVQIQGHRRLRFGRGSSPPSAQQQQQQAVNKARPGSWNLYLEDQSRSLSSSILGPLVQANRTISGVTQKDDEGAHTIIFSQAAIEYSSGMHGGNKSPLGTPRLMADGRIVPDSRFVSEGGGSTPPRHGGGGSTPPRHGGGGITPPRYGGGSSTPPRYGGSSTPLRRPGSGIIAVIDAHQGDDKMVALTSLRSRSDKTGGAGTPPTPLRCSIPDGGDDKPATRVEIAGSGGAVETPMRRSSIMSFIEGTQGDDKMGKGSSVRSVREEKTGDDRMGTISSLRSAREERAGSRPSSVSPRDNDASPTHTEKTRL